jgi:hypothetical protein
MIEVSAPPEAEIGTIVRCAICWHGLADALLAPLQTDQKGHTRQGIGQHDRDRAQSRGSPRPAALLGLSVNWMDQRPVVRRLRVCRRSRAGRRPDLAHAASRASCERVGRWRVDDHQRRHHRRWMGQLRQASYLFWLVRGSRRIRLLGRSDMDQQLRRRRRSPRSFTSFPGRTSASREEP